MAEPRVPPHTTDTAPEAVRDLFEHFEAERGAVPNMFRTAAVRPDHLRSLVEHYRTVMRSGTVSPLLKELVAIRVSSINHCRYCLASHTAAARQLGAREHWLLAVRHEEPEHGRGGTGAVDDMDKAWVIALRYAEQVAESGHLVDDALFTRLGKHFDSGEIVELTLVIGLLSYFNRFNDALRIPPTV